MSLTAGARLGLYEVSAIFGAGGMGEVYRAHGVIHRDLKPSNIELTTDGVAKGARG